MRILKIMAHISLDGVIAPGAPGEDSAYANGGWTEPYRHPAGRDAILAAHGTRFDLLLGRRTYDLWAGFWPTAPRGPMADPLNAATKYVVTHRPASLAWGPTKALGPDLIADVRRLKSQDGPDLILWGSPTVASPLLEHGLADEVVLIVYPLFLGQGKRLFLDETPPCKLTLTATQPLSSGIIVNTYTPSSES